MRGACYQVEHETRYVHVGRASTSQHVACLRPRASPRQALHWHTLAIEPPPSAVFARTDYFGNVLHQFEILTPYVEMRAVSRSLVEVWPLVEPLEPDASPAWEAIADVEPSARGAQFDPDVEFRYASPYVALAPELAEFARES